MEPHSDLIYDVGLFDGGDTAYYLFRGYRVVAIDANPLTIEKATARFTREIQDGRLTLLNTGVSRVAGEATFWISDVPEWSSFDREIASRRGIGHSAIQVPTAPFTQVLEKYGIPHYLKVDIEGNDGLCVEALKGGALPKYVSVESECAGTVVAATRGRTKSPPIMKFPLPIWREETGYISSARINEETPSFSS